MNRAVPAYPLELQLLLLHSRTDVSDRYGRRDRDLDVADGKLADDGPLPIGVGALGVMETSLARTVRASGT